MWLRKVLIVAAVAAPLVWSPMDASAQSRGQERAAQAQATHQGLTDAPAGLVNAFAGLTAPDALVNRFPGLQTQPEPEVEPEPEPEPESPQCESMFPVWVDGEVFIYCDGVLIPTTL
jgi:hypothetical protein